MARGYEGLFKRARATIGRQRLLSIAGGPALEVTEATGEDTRSFAELAMHDELAITVSVPRSHFEAGYPQALTNYKGALCTLDEAELRLARITTGRHAYRLHLVDRASGV